MKTREFRFLGVILVFAFALLSQHFKIVGGLGIMLGLFYIFGAKRLANIKANQKQAVAPSGPIAKNKFEVYTIFPAWYNKFPAVNEILKWTKENDEQYEGLKGKALREELEVTDRIYQYNMIYEPVYFQDEPTNKYNPQAMAIMSKEYGQVGYVPDSELEKVRQILATHPSAKSRLKLRGGNYKTLVTDDESYDFSEKIETVKGEWYADVEIKYEKS